MTGRRQKSIKDRGQRSEGRGRRAGKDGGREETEDGGLILMTILGIVPRKNTWKERDPLKLLESQLLGQRIIRRDDIAEMVVNIQQEVDQAFDFVEKSPFPVAEKAFTGLYR